MYLQMLHTYIPLSIRYVRASRARHYDWRDNTEPSAVRFASKAAFVSCHGYSNDFVRSLLYYPSHPEIFFLGLLMWNRGSMGPERDGE